MKRLTAFVFSLFAFENVYSADNVPFNGLICDIDGLGMKVQISV